MQRSGVLGALGKVIFNTEGTEEEHGGHGEEAGLKRPTLHGRRKRIRWRWRRLSEGRTGRSRGRNLRGSRGVRCRRRVWAIRRARGQGGLRRGRDSDFLRRKGRI